MVDDLDECEWVLVSAHPVVLTVKRLLGHLLRDDMINLVNMSVCTSTIKLNAATNQIVVLVKVDETFTTI